MKILPRKELVSLKQKEQEDEVITGMKIATQIDSLRELKQKEEQNLREFRDKSLAEVQEELNRKAEEDKYLSLAISNKKKELQKLFEPLDLQFALYVKTERESIEAEQKRLAEVDASLALREKWAANKDVEIKNKEYAIKSERLRVAKLHESAREEKEFSSAILVKAKSDAERMVAESETIIENAKAFERKIQLSASELKIKEDALALKEKEVQRRELEAEIEKLKYYSPVKRI